MGMGCEREREGVRKKESATVSTDRSTGPIRSGVDQQADQAKMGRPGQLGLGLLASKPQPSSN
jgi:hypothetical protein